MSLINKFFETERWERALEHGAIKGISKADLRELSDYKTRMNLYLAIKNGNYRIAPPHTQLIPKDTPGEFRTVYINENIDRVFLSILNDLLFEEYAGWIHPQCKSYQKGIGCGKVVQQVSKQICDSNGETIGFKADLSKYFDSVPIEVIDSVLDLIEPDPLIDILREYYHSDWCFDVEGNLIKHYQSLKQGCATASWFANVILYDMDDWISGLNGYYVRYSDDIVYIGEDYDKAMGIMKHCLKQKGLTLNPRKVEYLNKDTYFKFLGFAIKGENITISQGRLKKFQKEIESRTIKANGGRGNSYQKALNSVINYLYKGNGEYSWCSQILPIVNVEDDIQEMNKFVLDCLKACKTGKKKVGGLGYVPVGHNGVVVRGIGQNVKANRQKVDNISGFYTLDAMRLALITSRDVYDVLVMQM